ncbi:PIN domain-containing protein [Allochromatium vinosum]|uniref:PilT protein-like protein n=1 Tax=Allochromatium vinosum (strain ATCC 17899 / DSM 180 / NBRC 103801 / NCIMB 10441 / D) TaxID=572477 RepID=D3RWD7_ALLVD|nr:PIN domain-containing protein [Allochromatium vinosum]ADC64149.1 PilT protein-like protein [Allochromatium vinosum DSM 180]
MPAKVFVDTNIWLYALVSHEDDPKHVQAASFVLALQRPLINSQVIREASSNLLKKAGIAEAKLRTIIEDWYRDCDIYPSSAVQHTLASKLRETYSFSYWDSLIVAAALDAGCSTLFSEDMQHGQNIENRLTIINPFLL